MKISRILLMVPPVFTLKDYHDINPLPPIGLGYLAAVTEKMGIQTKIIDFIMHGWDRKEEIDCDIVRIGSSDAEIENCINEFNPELVGVSCQFSRENKIYNHILSLIKRVKPACITVAGGAHVSVCPDEILNNPSCDYVLIGEAENSFRDLIVTLEKNKDLNPVDGLGWKYRGKAYINEKKEWISDLDSLSFPAHHLMELERYFGIQFSHGQRHRKRFSPIVTSRGCPAKCTFCSAKMVWGDKYRVRSVENVLEEMKKLKTEYDIEELMFEDDNITANPKRAKEIFLGMIREGFGFVWDTPNGVGAWSIDEGMLDLMKKSGCVKLSFPVESGSQRVVDEIIKKPIELSKVRSLIKYCRKIRLEYNIFLVIGMPGEKIKDMWRSFYFAADCGCYLPNISIATPYPGTDLFDSCVKNGYLTRDFSFGDLFVRSFMIKTTDWDSDKLRNVLFLGELYLKLRWLLSEPLSFLGYFIRYIKQPKLLINYFRKYSGFKNYTIK